MATQTNTEEAQQDHDDSRAGLSAKNDDGIDLEIIEAAKILVRMKRDDACAPFRPVQGASRVKKAPCRRTRCSARLASMKLGGNGKPTAITTLREEPLGGDTEAEDSDSGQHCL